MENYGVKIVVVLGAKRERRGIMQSFSKGQKELLLNS